MRHMKLLGTLMALAAIVIFAAPALADDPFGGPVTNTSGNGATTWAAINIAEQCSPSLTLAAHSSRWFKADTSDDYKLQVWLDDDPQWGAASKYFENYPDLPTSDQSPNLINGFWLRVYAPDALNPNYAYQDQGHRADLLTTWDGIRADGTEVPAVGFANHNQFVANHLLWYEARFTGWVYIRVENKMQWDGNAIVCTHREYSPRPRPQPTPQDNQPSSGGGPCDWDLLDCGHQNPDAKHPDRP